VRPGWSVWGGVFFSFRGGELNDEKNYKIKYDEGLRWLNGGTQQPTDSRRQRWGGAFERRRDRGGTCGGGGCLFVPAGELNDKKSKIRGAETRP
jgi:hypothetical protein